MRCTLGYLADTAGTVDFWQKFLKPINVYARSQLPPVGVPPCSASVRPPPPVLARFNPRTAAHNRRLAASYRRSTGSTPHQTAEAG